MSFSYLFDPNKQFQDRNGVNNVGGFLRVYIDGTDDRATTYKDFNGTLNEADIMLDTDGRAVVIVDDSLTFRIEVYERDGALQWTVTQFTARGEGGGGGSSTPVVVDGTANEIDVTESMTAGVKYYTIGLATVVKNTLLGLLASLSNLVGILNSKADKVQGATAGNLAALDASGNLTDSGSKVADFKTKQTPVTDPSADGAGLEFIDSVTQDANGEITPHKKSVQDGTTVQKGVVKLSNAIDSTSVTEAATPKAVKDAYDELNNKIVARAVFLSQAEWAVQSQLPGDLAKVYYVENGTGEDAYTVYVWKESTSTYEEVDESSIDLDGYWHDSPTTTGNGNVVTNITLGNDGVPQIEKGLTALTQHQSVTDNDPTLAWSTRSKVGTIGGTDLHVTMPSNPASGKLDSTGDASNTTSTFTKASGDTSTMTSGDKLSAIFTAISSFFASVPSVINNLTSDSTTDALSAAQGKALVGKITELTARGVSSSDPINGTIWCKFANITCDGSYLNHPVTFLLKNRFTSPIVVEFRLENQQSYTPPIEYLRAILIGDIGILANSIGYTYGDSNGVRTYSLWLKCSAWSTCDTTLLAVTNEMMTHVKVVSGTAVASAPAGIVYTTLVEKYVRVPEGGKGSTTTPVYVDSNGQVQECDPSQMGVGAASYAEAVNLAKNSDSTNGDYIYVGDGTGQRIGNAGNAKTWDGHAISIGSVSSSAGTISIV